jgi:hypothetical protein
MASIADDRGHAAPYFLGAVLSVELAYQAAQADGDRIGNAIMHGSDFKAKGVKFGRKPKLTAHQRQEAIARRDKGETLQNIARSFNVAHTTILRLFPSPFEQGVADVAA